MRKRMLMAYYAYVRLEGVDRELISRDLDAENGDVLMLSDYLLGAEVELEDPDRNQDCVFKRGAVGWVQVYAATWATEGILRSWTE